MRIYLALFLLILSFESIAEEYDGLWVWESNSKKHTFSLRLERSGIDYRVIYCAVGKEGNRTDCSRKSKEHFNTTLNGEEFTFKTHYSRATGKAKLSIKDGKLFWEITEPPRGEHYAPKSAVLIKHEKNA